MIWVELTGILGLLCIVAMYQFNKRSAILWTGILSALVWTVQYILLGAYTGAGMNLWSAARNFAFNKYRSWPVLAVSLVSMAIICALTWKNWSSLLPVASSLFATLAMWQENPTRLRMVCILMVPFWLTYNYMNGSVAGMVGDMINFSSLFVGIMRFDILPKWRSIEPVMEYEYAEVEA